MTTPSHDTLNKQQSQRSVSFDEHMIQKSPAGQVTDEHDHYSLQLNSQHTIESALTMLDVAGTPTGKPRSALPRTKSLQVGKMKKERKARAQKQEQHRDSKKKRRSSTKPERRKSSSERHEGPTENNGSKSSSTGESAVSNQPHERDDLKKERKGKSFVKKCKRAPRNHSRGNSSSSSSRERRVGHHQSDSPKKKTLETVAAPLVPTSLPYIPSLEEGKPKAERFLRSTRSHSFRTPRQNMELEFSPNNLSPIASVGSQEEDSRKAKTRRPRSESIESKGAAAKRSMRPDKRYSVTKSATLQATGTKLTPTQDISASVRTERVSNLSSPDLDFLQFKREKAFISQRSKSLTNKRYSVTKSATLQAAGTKRNPTQHLSASVRTERVSNLSSPDLELLQSKRERELISQRSKSFRHAKVERGLDRTMSTPNLPPADQLSIGAHGQALVKTMRRNLEAFTTNHAPSEAEDMLSLMRETLDDVAAKHESSRRSCSTPRTRTTPPLLSSSLISSNSVPSIVTLKSRDGTPPRVSRQSSVRVARPNTSKSGKHSSRRRSLNDAGGEDEEKRAHNRNEERMERLGTNIDNLFQKWEALQQHQHRSKEPKKERQQRQSRMRRNSIASPVA